MAEQMTAPAQTQTAGSFAAVTAFAVGMGAGALLGMLLTPRSGRETREQMKQKATEARTKAMEKMDRKKEQVKGKVEEATDKAKKVAGDTRDQVIEASTSPRRSNAAM